LGELQPKRSVVSDRPLLIDSAELPQSEFSKTRGPFSPLSESLWSTPLHHW
jgi:hypothetical protein